MFIILKIKNKYISNINNFGLTSTLDLINCKYLANIVYSQYIKTLQIYYKHTNIRGIHLLQKLININHAYNKITNKNIIDQIKKLNKYKMIKKQKKKYLIITTSSMFV